MKVKLTALVLVPFILCIVVSSAFAQSYPSVAEGSDFDILGSIGFQHLPYATGSASSPGYTFTIENLDGPLQGSDARLGMNARGGTLSFHNEVLCHVQLYADVPITMHCSVDVSATVKSQSWNSTFPADTEILVTWGYELTPFYVTYWSILIGSLSIILLFAAVIMMAYAVRKHRFNILDADKTMLGIISICLFIFGIGLLFYWLLG